MQDRDRLFHFLSLFARWECALKKNQFATAGGYNQAKPNWTKFASDHEAAIAALDEPRFVAARDALLANPPRQELFLNDHVEWSANPRRKGETDAVYLFRVVRDVRNNLFHGGKYVRSSEAELARNRPLIDNAIALLECALVLNDQIGAMFEKPEPS